MAKSYWGAYSPPYGKHPGIPLDDYCVPEDAAEVRCDMQTFTCKDIPVFSFDNNSPLEKEDIEEKEEGVFLRPEHIVPFLKFLRMNRKRFFPPDGSQKWLFCQYQTLRFTRVSKTHFIFIGKSFFLPLNWKHFMQDYHYGEIHSTRF